MIKKGKITLAVEGEKKRLNLAFHSSFTRIAVGANDGKTNSGFTKYFRQLKREAESKKEADDYIFIFSVKEWEKRREEILHAKGKIIIIDNAGLTLWNDEEMKYFLDTGHILYDNQWIVKDWKDEETQLPPDCFEEEHVAWLTEVKRQDYTEVRLTYKEKLTELGGGKWLFTSKKAIEEYGLEYLEEPRDTEKDGTDEFDVVDISEWDSDKIKGYFERVTKAKVYSKSLPGDEVLKSCKIVTTDTETMKQTFFIESAEWEGINGVKLFYQIKEQTAQAKLLGNLTLEGRILGGTMLFLWNAKDPEKAEQLYATVVFNPDMEYVTFEVERCAPLETGQFSLRVADKRGLTDGDLVFLLHTCLKNMADKLAVEGFLLWEMGGDLEC